MLFELKNKNEDYIKYLYDEKELCIGEIAAIYGYCYSKTNKILKTLNPITSNSYGRRNSSYNQTFSEERKRKIGEKSKGRTIPPYERTEEIKEKISKSLIKYYSEHEVSIETREKLKSAWVNGSYKNAKMGRGRQGYFYSIKNKKDFYFRNGLELKFLIILEENKEIICYEVEPFQIKLKNNHHYTPDFLVNNKYLIELKAKDFLIYTKEYERFEEEKAFAKEYCKKNNLVYKIIYSDELDYDSKKFFRYINNNKNLIDKYNIRLKNNSQ